MSNTVITNYTDLNGPSTKADSSVVVIVNKDGSLSVDQKLLGTLMGSDGSQAAGISVVRVGHEGRPDDATDSESDDDKVPHVTLSVDSYYDEPNSIIKYDSGAEMLQSLRIETRENSLVGFQNDHCYTPLTSPGQVLPQRSDSFTAFDDPVIEITHTPPPKPIPTTKKITILEQQIIPKGKKIVLNPNEPSIILKGNDVLNKPLPILTKSKHVSDLEKSNEESPKTEENTESSSISSGESIPDRDSDSDYKDTKDRTGSLKVRRSKLKPRILKSVQPTKTTKIDSKVASRLKSNRSIIRKEIKEKIQSKTSMLIKKQSDFNLSISRESSLLTGELLNNPGGNDITKAMVHQKHTPKIIRKEKKTPAHVTALLSDMTSLFSTPDVIRRVSTDNKPTLKSDKDPSSNKKPEVTTPDTNDEKSLDNSKLLDNLVKPTRAIPQKTYAKQKDKNVNLIDKVAKGYDLIPQLDDASLAQILQDTTGITNPVKVQPSVTSATTMNSPGLASPLSPTLDLLAGLQPEEEGLTEDLLMHVAQLVESSPNLKEVIDKQVLGKVDIISDNSVKPPVQTPFEQAQVLSNPYTQTPTKTIKNLVPRKDPIEIVRRDGRVITLPPIEAPTTRASKRKSQVEPVATTDTLPTPTSVQSMLTPPEPQVQPVSKQYVNKKLSNKKQESIVQAPVIEKMPAESQESWNSEDDPYRLWCICKQPHNNRFMICCDGCEDWFHGKCVNITKAMGHQMEEQGIEWRCPNCMKKTKPAPKTPTTKVSAMPKKLDIGKAVTTTAVQPAFLKTASKTRCIVCKRPARASSIYCSDRCILKHAQDSLGLQGSPTKTDRPGRPEDKQKAESRVIVYERKTGRLLAGPNAPTAENLRIWLQKNPTFEVVRPGTLSTIKPNTAVKKIPSNDRSKIQTTLNFERIPKKSIGQSVQVQPAKLSSKEESSSTPITQAHVREETKVTHSPKTPVPSKSHQSSIFDSPKPSTSTAKPASESRKPARISARSHSSYDKTPATPSTSRKNSTPDHKSKMNSNDTIRENVRKALQEQLQIRMAENTGPKFTEEETRLFAFDTEYELHELFKDVGIKYKAKYRSLMFNIKDRKNLSLWQKICDRTITAKQLVRLSPEELASQELAQWRDKEAKHQLELIKKSELDLLAASKTYVLKTHKGEEVMETKESVSTELDPNVLVEDLVTALNDSVTDGTIEEPTNISSTSNKLEEAVKKYGSSKKRSKEDNFGHSKKSSRDSKRNSESRKSRSSRRKSDTKEKEDRGTRKSDRRSSRARSSSRERYKEEKQKSESTERLRSRSRGKSRRRSKSREHSRSTSQGRERSRSRARSKRRSRSRDISRKRHRSPSKHRSSTDEKHKHRSRSQENSKTKNDSTDSDSIERPKSAMLKEAHPEYDPHEPMITSAFSEEDLRKSREDVYEDSSKNEIKEDATDYDSSKAFVIDTNVILPSDKYVEKRVSEAESDQEPSSTVDNSTVVVWNGCINMVDVARFYVAAHEVSGSATDLEDDLSTELDIVGRINPDTVWDYISKMKRASNKDIIILRLQAANDEEKMQYIALYSYLSSRNRLGVVKVANTTTVKDFYVVPLAANTTLPSVLLPLDGPGLGEVRTHLLLAIVIRQRRKRMAPRLAKDVIPAKVSCESHPRRSYTPPLNKGSYTPPTSPRRRLPLPTYTSPALSSSVKDKIAATLACTDEEEAYSPGSSSSGGSGPPTSLRTKMDELNRQIEEQKQQILNMARADSSSVEDEEAYSPSRPMTPPTPVAVVPLAEIALPSNLHEILATIKQRETTADVDMRVKPQ